MKPYVLVAAALAAAAATAAEAVVVNISATDFSASSQTVTLTAGRYEAELIKGVYTAWAPARPSTGNWTGYYKYTINGVSNFYNPLNSVRFATPDAAFNAYSATPFAFTLASTTQVTFSTADWANSFGDNTGGLSISINAVPEPATWAMLVLGFFAVGLGLRRKGARAAVTA